MTIFTTIFAAEAAAATVAAIASAIVAADWQASSQRWARIADEWRRSAKDFADGLLEAERELAVACAEREQLRQANEAFLLSNNRRGLDERRTMETTAPG